MLIQNRHLKKGVKVCFYGVKEEFCMFMREREREREKERKRERERE